MTRVMPLVDQSDPVLDKSDATQARELMEQEVKARKRAELKIEEDRNAELDVKAQYVHRSTTPIKWKETGQEMHSSRTDKREEIGEKRLQAEWQSKSKTKRQSKECSS